MHSDDIHFHYVCTLAEAKKLVAGQQEFWVSNCGCREERGTCRQSRVDLCVTFYAHTPTWGSGTHPADRREIETVLREAEQKHLVPRPFRDKDTKTVTEGICFCCGDCCDYFIKPDQPCNKGIYLEQTDDDLCTHCGTCEDYCFFKARIWDGEELTVLQDNCYGCGVCVDICPEGAIDMILR